MHLPENTDVYGTTFSSLISLVFLCLIFIVPLEEDKFSLNADGTALTVHNVTKDDVMCVQCNVSNSRGYAFGDGYLAVIGKP